MDPATSSSDPFAAYGGQALPNPPPPAPATSGADPFAQYGGKATPTPAAPNTPGQPAPQGLAYNANGEATYQMKNPQGQAVSIPYSNVGRALDQGHLFADKGTLQQYARDHAADPLTEGRVDRFMDRHPYLTAPLSVIEGIGGAALQTLTGADRTPTTRGETEAQLAAATPAHGIAQGVGELGEGVGEFFSAEELLGLLGKTGEAMGVADRFKQANTLAKIVNDHPMIAKLLKIGASAVKQGTIVSGQTYLKTGSPGAAAEGGLGAAAAGAALGGLSEGAGAVRNAIGKRATTLEDVGGVETPIPGNVRNPKVTPQQKAGQASIKNAARGTLAGHLEEVNESRAVPPSAPALPASTGPYEFNLRGPKTTEATEGSAGRQAERFEPAASHVPAGQEPGPQTREQLGSTAATIPDRLQQRTQAYTSGNEAGLEAKGDVVTGGGTLKTQDPNIAQMHVSRLNEVVESDEFQRMPPAQQQDILAARHDAMKQLGAYYEKQTADFRGNRPNFEPIDIRQTLARTHSYTDAADELDKIATEGYEHFDKISGGRFTNIRQANKNAWRAFKSATTEDGRNNAQAAIEDSNQRMAKLMSDMQGAVTPKELSGFNEAYKRSQQLKAVAEAVDGSFSGNASASARSWEYRGFDGNRLMSSMSRLQQRVGRPALDRLVGKENVDTLFRVAELNRTQAQRAKFGQAIAPVARQLLSLHVGPIAAGAYLGHFVGMPYEWGGAAGWAITAASKRVMNAVLTNPKVAQNLMFAIDSGAKPERYAPMIAEMIQQQETQSEREQATKGEQ